jgi:hypothetical protein
LRTPGRVSGVWGVCFELVMKSISFLAGYSLGTGVSVLECTLKARAPFIVSPPILQTSDEILAKTGVAEWNRQGHRWRGNAPWQMSGYPTYQELAV